MLDAVGRSLVEPSAMEPIGAGESVRFDLARCLTAPSNLDGQIKEEPSLGQIYSFFPVSLKRHVLSDVSRHAHTH
jgi:hypothetical protein